MCKLATTAFASLLLGVGLGFSIEAARSPGAEEPKALEALIARFEGMDLSFARLERSLTDRPPVLAEAEGGRTATFDETKLSLAIEQIVRDELRGALAKSAAKACDSLEADVSTSPESEAAYELAHETVWSAVASRRWTEEDREVLRTAMPELSPAQWQEVAEGLAAAINDGQIEIEGAFPF